MLLRGHHLLCIHGFRGYGYSQPFVAHMQQVVAALQTDPMTKVRPVTGIGTICDPCPHRRGQGCSRDPDAERRMAERDRRVLDRLQLRPGEEVPWQEVLNRIARSVRPQDMPDLCRAASGFPSATARMA